MKKMENGSFSTTMKCWIWMNDEAFRISGNITVVNSESDLPWRNREKQ